jgi:hypothetical protein
MLTKNAITAPFTHPDRYTRGTDAAMYTTLGLPTPTPAPVSRQPRAFVATEPSRASCRPGAVVTRSHRHHAESEA